jgi:Protein of unknown function (DUF3592)
VIHTDLERAYSARGGMQYLMKAVYRYTVDGKTYQSDRISFHETWGGGTESVYRDRLKSKYPVGKPHVVYYNPADPSVACLETGPNYFILVLGSFLSLLFVVSGFFSPHHASRCRSAAFDVQPDIDSAIGSLTRGP